MILPLRLLLPKMTCILPDVSSLQLSLCLNYMYILVSESFHIRLTGRSLLHPVKVKLRFRYKPEWFRECWNSLCKPHHHPPPSISYHLPSYGTGLKLTTQGKPLSEILPLKSCLLQMRSLKYRTSAESFPWGIRVESHGFQRG